MNHNADAAVPRPRWWWLLHLPPTLLELCSGLAAGVAWLADLRGCRSTVAPLIGRAMGCSRWRSLWLSWQATRNAFTYTLDSAGLLLGPSSRLRTRAQRGAFEGAAHLQQALAEGRGVVLAASFHACFYDALLARFGPAWPGLDEVPLHLVVPRRDPLLERLCKRIAAHGGRRCQFIAMGSPTAAVLMARALRRGEIVLCMVDNVPEGAAVMVVPFLGRPTLMPVGFLVLAGRTASPVLTCHTVRRAGRFITRLAPVDPVAPALTGHSSCSPLQQRADTLAARLEQPVRADPGGWNSWLTLAQRWQLAAELNEEP